jgi:hypothetical protein
MLQDLLMITRILRERPTPRGCVRSEAFLKEKVSRDRSEGFLKRKNLEIFYFYLLFFGLPL